MPIRGSVDCTTAICSMLCNLGVDMIVGSVNSPICVLLLALWVSDQPLSVANYVL